MAVLNLAKDGKEFLGQKSKTRNQQRKYTVFLFGNFGSKGWKGTGSHSKMQVKRTGQTKNQTKNKGLNMAHLKLLALIIMVNLLENHSHIVFTWHFDNK